jgi:hypothetical protein
MRTSLCLAGIASVIAMAPVPPLHADVYRCVTDDGHISYQQIPCNAQSAPLHLREQRNGEAGLRAGEKALLKGYAHRDSKRRRKANGKPKQVARPDRACWQKREQLEAVRAQLRRGYRVGKGDELRRKQDRYEDYLRQFCASR